MKADLTAEQAEKQYESHLESLKRARVALGDAANKITSHPGDILASEELQRLLNEVARAEARLVVAHIIKEHVDAEDGSVETIQKDLHSRVLAGPNDTWSGRGNEIKRVYFDGLLDAVKIIVRGF